MATLLYRIGRYSYRHAWRVIGVWLLLTIGALGAGIGLGGQTQESFAIPGTESQQALDRLEAVFPAVAGASASVVYVAEGGASVTDPAARAAIADMAEAIGRISGVDAVVSPFSEYAGDAVSADGRMAYSTVQFTGAATEVTPETLAALKDTADIGERAGLRVEFGGQVFQEHSFGITIIEAFGVVFAAVVLVITFGSLLAAGMPLLSALIGVGIVMGVIMALSAFTSVSSSAPLLALMIGLAVGIDYALFILSRHRSQLASGEDPEESAALATGTAGSAVVFAGVTVIIALLGLLVVGIPFLSVMGVAAAVAVLLAVGVAITLLPALLGLAKGRLAPRPGTRAHRRAVEAGRPAMGARWVRLIMKAPIVAALAVVAVLGALAVPALDLELSLPDGGSEPAASTQRQAYDLISEGFGPGHNGPLVIAVDITQTTEIQRDLEGIGDTLRGLDDVAYVSPGMPDAGLDTAIIQVIPDSAPDSVATKALVQSIRGLAPELEQRYGTAISVTGTTAVGIDISDRLSQALIPFGLIVVGLSFVLLMAVFRSVLVPAKAALGFLLSVVASFGVVVAVFQWGWLGDVIGVESPGPILSFMPIILMAVLFGLAMDYEVFLVSGMREEFVRSGDARGAVVKGFAAGARVVTAAALIMFFVFFAFVPEGSGTIKPIALGLAVGIAFDAFLVRMTLVPAVMALLGRAAWWLPQRLGRALPRLDIEGEGLREHRAAAAWAAGQHGFVLSAEGLLAGSVERAVGPLGFRVPAGAVLVAGGDPGDRRVLAATVAGRLGPIDGMAQVAGHPLPSDAAAVLRLVAMADAGEPADRDGRTTVGILLSERLRLTGPVLRPGVRGRCRRWIAEIGGVLGSDLRAETALARLSPLERAVVTAAAALAERTPVVVIAGPALPPPWETEFATAVCRLAPAGTTLVFGSPSPAETAAGALRAGREVVELAIASGAAREDGATREDGASGAGGASGAEREGAAR